MAEPVVLGPHQMTLDLELLQVLTAGDTVGLEELLRREEQTNGHVAINVQPAAPVGGAAAAAPPLPGTTSCLLGVTSNGNTALHLAASRGHAGLAALICERAPSLVATRNSCLDTPLHCAAKAGSKSVAACLLSKMRGGVDADADADAETALRARNTTGATALYEAVRHGRVEVVDLLMTKAPELASLATEESFSPLYLAASSDSLQIVRSLLRPLRDGTPSPASFSGPDGRSALHVAVARIKEIAQEILKWEPVGPTLLTEVDSSGRTPLQYAVLYGRLDVVELFLDGHTSEQARIPDIRGLFPVHTAAMVGSWSIIEEVAKKCPHYRELVDHRGRNLLHCAVEHNQGTVVRRICDCEKDKFVMLLNAIDAEGNTPLHLAVKHGFPRIVSLLLQTVTVELGITNKDGLTAGDLGHRALERGRSYYFLNPHCLVFNCLRWTRAPITLDGDHPLYVDKKLTDLFHNKIKSTEEEEASSSGDDNMTKTGTIASVLIATVAFAAAFTVPGGFIADDHPGAGTAILARRFAFRAFVVSDTMAFACSIVATCFLIYGGAKEIPRNHRLWYDCLASGLVPVAAQFMIGAFAFGFQLVLGNANRSFVVFVYVVSLAAVLVCFPGIWVPMHLGLAKAVWRRAGWRGIVNVHVHERPSSLLHLFRCFTTSILFENLRRPLFVLLISAAFIVAVALNIALPNY